MRPRRKAGERGGAGYPTGDIGMTEQEDFLGERLRFEELLSELSAKFVNLPAIDVNDQIEAGLQRIVEFLKIDCSAVNRSRWRVCPTDFRRMPRSKGKRI